MSQRENAYCYMRAVSAIAIIMLHTFQYAFSSFTIIGKSKIFSVVVRNDLLWAVPVFVMVTGALMLAEDRKLSYTKLFGKYLKKILILLIVCLFASRMLDQYILHVEEEESIFSFLKNTICDFLAAQGWSEFWYLYLLVAIYISLPAFRAMIRGKDTLDLKYIIWILFLFQSLLPFIFRLCGVESGWYTLFFSIYPFYLIVGYYLKGGRYDCKIMIFGVVIFLMVQSVLTIICFMHGFTTLIKEIELYSFPGIVLTAIFIFGLCMEWGKKEQGLIEKFLLKIDPYTLDMYVIHLFLLRILFYGLGVNPYKFGLYMIFIETMIVFSMSLLIALICHVVIEKIYK